MVPSQSGYGELPDSDSVARYCRPRTLLSNGRPARAAFMLRPGEEYLSANWLEYFHAADRPAQLAGVRRALAGKGFRMSRAARFAVLNVGAAVSSCQETLDTPIRFIALGDPRDPSHTGIYGSAAHSAAAALLAATVAASDLYPAII